MLYDHKRAFFSKGYFKSYIELTLNKKAATEEPEKGQTLTKSDSTANMQMALSGGGQKGAKMSAAVSTAEEKKAQFSEPLVGEREQASAPAALASLSEPEQKQYSEIMNKISSLSRTSEVGRKLQPLLKDASLPLLTALKEGLDQKIAEHQAGEHKTFSQKYISKEILMGALGVVTAAKKEQQELAPKILVENVTQS